MAIPAVSVALSKFNEVLSSSPCEADDQVEELVAELTWMLSFLVDGEKTPTGRVRTDLWSAAIERLAVCAQQLQSTNKSREIAYLNKRFASLREKILPFIPCHVPSTDSAITPEPFIPVAPTIQSPKEIQVGVWGGPGGDKWNFKPKGMIKQITIVHGVIIDSISFTGVSADGKVDAPVKYGGTGGSRTSQVNINGPSEYLTGISGTFGFHNNLNVIRSLRFQSNVSAYGPFGTNDGTPFTFAMQDGKIVGFHGRAGVHLDAIGVYVTSM